MKGLSYSFLRAICALVIGLVLVMFPDQAGDYFVITIGVIFLVPSLISIIGYFAQSTEMRSRFPIEGVGSLLFGLWLIIMPGFFADLLTFVLGFILVMGGVQQIASLSAARRWMPVPGGFYVVPVLILHAGSCGILYHSGAHSDSRAGCLVQSDGGTFHGIYHYRYQQSGLCGFGTAELVQVYASPPEDTGCFSKGSGRY